ncbi:hypothetical protein [uncultured Algibacter sp.]|uniref:hypothetical protein n=1 Tax=uncultured Algibacter sp. TaxID=298659 RepID=UPI002616DAE6|nr:hypothetical protein [uncultured Algibacter sp.]
MKHSYFKTPCLGFALFFLTFVSTFAQKTSDNTTSSVEIPDLEKVYLHTDRDYYALGESIWYKAYSVYGYTNVLFDYSKTLYVELIAPDSKIIARNITRLEKGIGHGDFKLTDSIGVKSGTYQLRAYTNWMRNFDKPFVFTKNIEIIDLIKNKTSESDENVANGKPKNSKHTSKKNSTIDIQFFPEGGALIENVLSVVAFKAVDNKGNPIDVSGEVYDANGDFISMFKSQHVGMGKFSFTPEANQTYNVKLTGYEEEMLNIKFPKVQEEGYTLNITSRKGKHYISIKTNEATHSKQERKIVSLVASTRGVTYFQGDIPIENVTTTLTLPIDNMPEGICRITLYDDLNRPQSERLLFIEKDNGIEVSITPDKTHYSTKEKVNLTVSAKTKEGIPIDGSFSLSSTDGNTILKSSNTNICAYYLLQSDIKGDVFEPAYYFNKANKGRLYHLDLLLLTQGWRDFIWKALPEKKEKTYFRLEKGLKISGRVTSLLSAKARPNRSISVLLNKNNNFIELKDTTNVSGNFLFNDLYFKGTSMMMINTKDEKGKDKGQITLDSLYRDPIVANFRGSKLYRPLQEKRKAIGDVIYRNNMSFNVPIENVLDEVVVTGKAKKQDDESIFGTADHTFIVPDDGPNFSTIYQLISFNIPGVNVRNGNVSFNRNSGPALILLDGMEMSQSELEFIAPEDVRKIESIKTSGASILGSRGDNGAILIYTKTGGLNRKSKSTHSVGAKIHGYQETRVFYSPNYDKPETIDKTLADVRNTLYWRPYVHPNENGIAEVSYFNSAVKTKVNITLEGMTTSGIPVVVNGSYIVE